MKLAVLALASLASFNALAEINIETHNFEFIYGSSYHVLQGEQKNNNTKGRLTSPQYPFWSASYSFRFSRNWAIKFYGGLNFVRFDEPQNSSATLKNETLVLNNYGLELQKKTGAFTRWGAFFAQQDHPLYFAKTPTEFKMIERSFYESGITWQIGQRRRIGLIWGIGAKGFAMFPTDGGKINTELGLGGEAHARLGWIGPLGTTYQIRGFYQATSAPNAEVTFTHEQFGYAGQVNLTF